MKTIYSLVAVFVLFLAIGFGVTMISPVPAMAAEDGCNPSCGFQFLCGGPAQCPPFQSPYYKFFQAEVPIGCQNPFNCGGTFAFCGTFCNQI